MYCNLLLFSYFFENLLHTVYEVIVWSSFTIILLWQHNNYCQKKFASQKAWQTWLAKNYHKSNDVWLMFAKRNASSKTVTYAEALDVALCYGWIDGQKQSHDEEYWMQKFVPRQTKSIWSKKNIEHTQRLIKEGEMQPAGLKAIEAAKANGTWEKAYDAQSKMTIPEDFLKE